MPEPLTVLHSLPGVRPTTNPYLVMLRERLRATDGLRLMDFGYRSALTARYDVFHVHWPEILLAGSGRLRRLVRQVLLVVFLIRLTLTRTPVVRTVHNVERPDGLAWHEYRLLAWIDRLTKVRIVLNARTELPPGQHSVLIPHGHYRDWYARLPHPPAVPGRYGYAGLIRRYKGVEALLAAFTALPADPAVSLQVAGRPSSPELAETIRALAGDPRISCQLDFLAEDEFAAVLSSAELVVLPYRFMHNSGGALAALSLDRPVLVPDNPVNTDLAAEVGTGWVQTFTGELDAADLVRALAAVRGIHGGVVDGPGPEGRPDLSARDWEHAGPAHLAAYQTAVQT